MKKRYIILFIVLFSVIACNDNYLEKFPFDKINDASFWKTDKDIELFANQFYVDLKPTNTTAFSWASEDPTDNNGPTIRDPFTWNESTLPTTGGGWAKADWAKIRSCNIALDHISTMQKSPSVLQNEGEIRFFKSFYYFAKVKYFGDVPWLSHDLNIDSEDLTRARDPRKLVIDSLLKNLDFAATYLPATSSTDRLTRYAALALKSQVCLYEGTFRKYRNLGDYETLLRGAVDAASTIMSSGLFAVYSTGKPAEDYFNLFIQDELKGNKEGIMIQRYMKDLRTHTHVRLSNESHTGYTKDFVETYLCTDGLPISVSPLYKGDAVFGDEFVGRDPRMQQSVYNSNRPFTIYQNGTIYYKPMPEFTSTSCYTSYFILKGFNPDDRYREATTYGITDDFIYRYAEILLNYAEAKAELNECTQADLDKSINLLRDRVNMPHLTVAVGFVDPNWPNWEVPVTPLINEIRRERRIELADEGYRWDDLVRWKAGKLLENPKVILGARDPKTGQYRVLYPGFTRKWDDKLYLHPIPTQEITLNPNLKQNPGW